MSIEELIKKYKRVYEEGDGIHGVPLRSVKKGTYIKRKADSNKVYKKGDYDNTHKKFICDDTEDISKEILLKGSTIVFVGFTY